MIFPHFLGQALKEGVIIVMNSFVFLSFTLNSRSFGPFFSSSLIPLQLILPQLPLPFPDHGSRQSKQKSLFLHLGHLTLLVVSPIIQTQHLQSGQSFVFFLTQISLFSSSIFLSSDFENPQIRLIYLSEIDFKHFAYPST